MSNINDIILLELNRSEQLFHTLSPDAQVQLAKTGAVRPQEIMNNGSFHGSLLLKNLYNADYKPLEQTPLGQTGLDMGIHALPGQNTGISAVADAFDKNFNPLNLSRKDLGMVTNPEKNTVYYPTNDINNNIQASLNSLYGSGLSPILLRHETNEIRSGLKGPHTSVRFHNDQNREMPETTDTHGSPRILQDERIQMQQAAPWDKRVANVYNYFSQGYRYSPEVMNLSSRQIRKLEKNNRKNFQQGVNLLQNYPKEHPEEYQNVVTSLKQGDYTNPNFAQLWNTVSNTIQPPTLHGTPTNDVINYNPNLQPYYNATPEQLAAQKNRQSQELANNQNYIQNKQNNLLDTLRARANSLK